LTFFFKSYKINDQGSFISFFYNHGEDKMCAARKTLTNEERLKKSDLILKTAEKLFLEKDYRKISMNEIAQKAGSAKGTLYLYFKSKESLFLSLMLQKFRDWFVQLENLLSKEKTLNPLSMSKIIGKSLADKETFSRLLLLQASVLESNADYQSLKNFKSELKDMLLNACEHLTGVCPAMSRQEALDFFLWLYAMAIGLKSLSEPNKMAKTVIQNEGLDLFEIDFLSSLEKYILSYLNGIQNKHKE